MKKLTLIPFLFLFAGMLNAQVDVSSIKLDKYYSIKTNEGNTLIGKVILKNSIKLTLAREGRVDLVLPLHIISNIREIGTTSVSSANAKVRFSKADVKLNNYYEIWTLEGSRLIVGKAVFVDSVKLIIERMDHVKMNIPFSSITSIEKSKDTIQEEKPSNQLDVKIAPIINRQSFTIYTGAGKIYPGKAIKNNIFHTTLIGFDLEAYLPLYAAGPKEKYSVGLNLGSEYFYGNAHQLEHMPVPYNIVGQLASPTIDVSGPFPNGLKVEFGLQCNLILAKHFVISPILGFGFMVMTQEAYSVRQKTIVNTGGNRVNSVKYYELLSQDYSQIIPNLLPIICPNCTSSTSGFRSLYFAPKLKLHGFLNNGLGLWAEVNYMLGPGNVYYKYSIFTPQGAPDQDGAYTLAQMDAGTKSVFSGGVNYKSIGLKVGVAYTLPTRFALKLW